MFTTMCPKEQQTSDNLIVKASKTEISPEGLGYIRPWASATEKKRNILDNLALGKTYRPVLAFFA